MTTTNNDLNNWLATPPPATESAHCFHGDHDDCRTADCPCTCGHGMRNLLMAVSNSLAISTVAKEFKGPASASTIRTALYDVLDGGCNCEGEGGGGAKHPWELDDDVDNPELDHELVSAQRERFADAVIVRIVQLQTAPHNMDAGLLAMLGRAQKVLRRGGRR